MKEVGFRTHGKSKDSRDDLPRVVVGMAVTRDGIPVRVWSWPGATADSGLIRQVKDDMRAWSPSRIVWVADRGFSSAKNRRALMAGAGGYSIGEKLRSGSIATKANLDGKYLLRSSDPKPSAEDIALGCKQLLEAERGWRDMKQVLDLRRIYHRREDRIRAHVHLCRLALLLMRVAENTCGQTWNTIRTEAQRIHAVIFTGPAGTLCKTTALPKTQRDLFAAAHDPNHDSRSPTICRTRVKVRGFRIEIGEVEHHLRECASVRNGAVVVCEDAPGGTEPAEPIRDQLPERLPDHMIPTPCVWPDDLLLNRVGKVDRAALTTIPLPARRHR